jgi:isoleucyl-tRNA synthetase
VTTLVSIFVHGTLADYLKVIKDRLYCEPLTSYNRRVCVSILSFLCESLCKLLAPIVPHLAEEAFEELMPGKAASIFQTGWAKQVGSIVIFCNSV